MTRAEQGGVLILAGGRSRRMGRDKAGLPLADTTLLDWQSQRLRALGLPVWHSGPGGIRDVWPDFRGPLAGLYSALVHRPTTSFWVLVPVDMPALPVARLRHLVQAMGRERVPVAYHNSPLPLALPTSADLRKMLESWLERPEGPRSVQALMQHTGGQWMAEPLTGPDRLNLNTPEDWQAFQAQADFPGTVPNQRTGDLNEPY